MSAINLPGIGQQFIAYRCLLVDQDGQKSEFWCARPTTGHVYFSNVSGYGLTADEAISDAIAQIKADEDYGEKARARQMEVHRAALGAKR